MTESKSDKFTAACQQHEHFDGTPYDFSDEDIVLIFSQVEVTNDTGTNISFNRWMIPASSGSSATSLGGYVVIPMGASASPNIHHSVAEIMTADSGRTGNVYYNFIASCNSTGSLSVNYVQENIQIIRR